MASPSSRLPSRQEGSNSNNDGDQPADQRAPKASSEPESTLQDITQPPKTKPTNDPLEAFVDSLREPEGGHHFHMICKDGVMRVIRYLPGPPDQPTATEIYDAKPMSPELIKSWLDRWPWSQEKEDRFRGVDGRTVPQEQWMNPPADVVGSFGTKNERDEAIRRQNKKILEERAELGRKIASGELGEDARGPSCMAIQSDHDLRPRRESSETPLGT